MGVGQRGEFGVVFVASGEIAVAGAPVRQTDHATGHAHFAQIERRTGAAHAPAHQRHADFRRTDHLVVGVAQGGFMVLHVLATVLIDMRPGEDAHPVLAGGGFRIGLRGLLRRLHG